MPADRKRKSRAEAGEAEDRSPKRQHDDQTDTTAHPVEDEDEEAESPRTPPADPVTTSPEPASRTARFKALQARQQQSRTSNRRETALESQRAATDPAQLTALTRKRDIATHKLLQADAAATGADFERKRAWDWTAEEAARWDRRVEKKAAHREDVAFHDYRAEARKVYKRQMKGVPADVAAYEKEKAEAVRRGAESGGLEIVETADGEVVAVDREGAFYASVDSTGFTENRPEKARVDALVADLKKAEEVRLRKRAQRARAEEDGDVTYINDKNKQFNQKLARFYNKYTSDIRDSFERGTAI